MIASLTDYEDLLNLFRIAGLKFTPKAELNDIAAREYMNALTDLSPSPQEIDEAKTLLLRELTICPSIAEFRAYLLRVRRQNKPATYDPVGGYAKAGISKYGEEYRKLFSEALNVSDKEYRENIKPRLLELEKLMGVDDE